MKRVVITADSAADLPKDVADRYGIIIMPMNVVIENEVKKDGVDITARELFDFVDNKGKTPSTSAVSPGEYSDFFERNLSNGNAVVHLAFCSELSSTCRNAKMAASMLDGVYVIDTRNLAGGMALLAIKGCEMRDNGMGAEEIYSHISSLVPSARVSYLLDSIDFLRRSGRCSAAVALGASLLSIKPCAAMVNGSIEVIKKYRGKAQTARLQYASEQLEKYSKIDYSTAFIYHSGVDSAELAAIEEILKNKGFEQVVIAFTGCMISLHSGEKALGIHFIAD